MFQATKLFVIAILLYIFVVATASSHRDLNIFRIFSGPSGSVKLLRHQDRQEQLQYIIKIVLLFSILGLTKRPSFYFTFTSLNHILKYVLKNGGETAFQKFRETRNFDEIILNICRVHGIQENSCMKMLGKVRVLTFV